MLPKMIAASSLACERVSQRTSQTEESNALFERLPDPLFELLEVLTVPSRAHGSGIIRRILRSVCLDNSSFWDNDG